MDQKLIERPLPSLQEWLGNAVRADGFDAWVKETVFLERAVAHPHEAAMVRISKTMAIAMIETMNREAEHGDVDVVDANRLMCRVLGSVFMASLVSILDADKSPPMIKLARIFSEEFEAGAKSMARGIIASNATARSQ